MAILYIMLNNCYTRLYRCYNVMFIAEVLVGARLGSFHYNGKPVKFYATSGASSLDNGDDIRGSRYRFLGNIGKWGL